jgi:hypothetical protein
MATTYYPLEFYIDSLGRRNIDYKTPDGDIHTILWSEDGIQIMQSSSPTELFYSLIVSPGKVFYAGAGYDLGGHTTPWAKVYSDDFVRVHNIDSSASPATNRYVELTNYISLDFHRLDNNVANNILGVNRYYGVEEISGVEYEVESAHIVIRQTNLWNKLKAREDVEIDLRTYDGYLDDIISRARIGKYGMVVGNSVSIPSGKFFLIGPADTDNTWGISGDSTTFKIGHHVSGSYSDGYLAISSDGIKTKNSSQYFDFKEITNDAFSETPNKTLKINYNGTEYEIPAYLKS